ncbi:hypothetical protein DB354_02960 [Opitutus sp. ER46]|nr:hypothetical protein DB354_02960 [Opitutus sp. ER46]
MLLEALEHWLTPCPRPWRELGYLHEQIAIDARLRRNHDAWAPHLQATRRAILDAAELCARPKTALLLGAGIHHDVPLVELASRFERVLLADLVHRPRVRRRAAAISARIACVEFDVTGILGDLMAHGRAWNEEEMVERVRHAPIGLPPGAGEEPDLVVSANLCAQLMLLPYDWLARQRPTTDDLAEQLERAAAERHLEWLRQRRGVSLLISETERRQVSPTGEVLDRERVPGLGQLGVADRKWLWRVAPIPEASRAYHREHLVGTWYLRGGPRRGGASGTPW